MPARANRPRRVTSADVAKASGVSRATVSYVLNNRLDRNISPTTRQLVLDKARELGHVPDAAARALKLGRSDVVLVIVRDFTLGHFRDEMLAAVDQALTSRGYLLLVHRYSPDVRTLEQLWPQLMPDVVVTFEELSTADRDAISSSHAQLVEVRKLYRMRTTGELQVQYLHSRGHREIGYAAFNREQVRMVAAQRLLGSEATAKKLGLPELMIEVIDDEVPGSVDAALDAWLTSPRKITAVCAHNDEIAAMIAVAMSRRGLKIGEDLAVIGIDDVRVAQSGITSVSYDLSVIAERLIESVVASIEDRSPKFRRAELHHVVVRQSA